MDESVVESVVALGCFGSCRAERLLVNLGVRARTPIVSFGHVFLQFLPTDAGS